MMDEMDSELRFTFRRVAANGRTEVACRITDDHLFWLTDHELASWTVCPHCVGWVSHWPGSAGRGPAGAGRPDPAAAR